MAWGTLLKGFAKIGPKAGEALGTGFKGFSAWVSTWKIGNVIKIGGAGGIIAVAYSTWKSAVNSISDATGLPDTFIETAIGVSVAVIFIAIIVRIIVPKRREDDFSPYSRDDYYDYRRGRY